VLLRGCGRRLVNGRARGLQAYGKGDGADFEDIPNEFDFLADLDRLGDPLSLSSCNDAEEQ
jgi:hypothetical protein